jgi:ribonuclease-3
MSERASESGAHLNAFVTDPALLQQSLSHRSYCAEVLGASSNERLEFLGDAILGLVVTDELYHRHPELPEGDLARIRAAVVSTEALAPVAERLGLGEALLLGRGEAASGGRKKLSILADVLEAFIGATYLCGGIEAARTFVLEVLSEAMTNESSRAFLGDPKNRLQERAARDGDPSPRYDVRAVGPDHARHYYAEVALGDVVVGRGEGRSKKHAERAAAQAALRAVSREENNGATNVASESSTKF